jgi:hypothetical protein
LGGGDGEGRGWAATGIARVRFSARAKSEATTGVSVPHEQ